MCQVGEKWWYFVAKGQKIERPVHRAVEKGWCSEEKCCRSSVLLEESPSLLLEKPRRVPGFLKVLLEQFLVFVDQHLTEQLLQQVLPRAVWPLESEMLPVVFEQGWTFHLMGILLRDKLEADLKSYLALSFAIRTIHDVLRD